MSAKISKFIRFAFTVIVVNTSLLLAAFGKKENTPLTMLEGAWAMQLIGLDPSKIEAQGVEYAVDCGILAMVENRSFSESRQISLPVTLVHALGHKFGKPVFWFVDKSGSTNFGFSNWDPIGVNKKILFDAG